MLEQQRNPGAQVIRNLRYLALKTLQPLRSLLRSSIAVSSGYRCEALNSAINGSKTSQHMKGEAADISLSNEFLTRPSRQRIRNIMRNKVRAETGLFPRDTVNANYYLFACICMYLDELDVDQVIHEYGEDGAPSWVHVSCSRDDRNRRQILIKRSGEGYIELTLNEAIKLGC
jgi:hypothetical protein